MGGGEGVLVVGEGFGAGDVGGVEVDAVEVECGVADGDGEVAGVAEHWCDAGDFAVVAGWYGVAGGDVEFVAF